MSGSLTWIGTATTLLRYGGFTLLTDPNFLHRGQRAYLGKGLSSARLTEPALQVDELPPLDAVVLSHLHGDHFDRVARAGLPLDVPILTTPASARALRRWGFSRTVGLRTWQSHELRSAAGDVVRLTAAPGTHARGVLRALLPPVMGSVLDFRPAGEEAPLSVYITGDTLLVDDLREIPRRHPSLDVGLWHLGGTRLPGLRLPGLGLPGRGLAGLRLAELASGAMVTMDGRMGADLMEIITPRTVVPIHHGDYGIFRSPLSDFLDEVARRGLTGVRPLARGESMELPGRRA